MIADVSVVSACMLLDHYNGEIVLRRVRDFHWNMAKQVYVAVPMRDDGRGCRDSASLRRGRM